LQAYGENYYEPCHSKGHRQPLDPNIGNNRNKNAVNYMATLETLFFEPPTKAKCQFNLYGSAKIMQI
jgi:hypothetical protein